MRDLDLSELVDLAARGIAVIAVALGVASEFRLDDERVRQVLAEVASAVSAWRTLAGAFGLPEKDIDVMTPAFDALKTVPF